MKVATSREPLHPRRFSTIDDVTVWCTPPLACFAALALAVCLVASCSSTRIEGSWLDPAFAARPLVGPILVVGAMGDETTRRLYEDAMARSLAAHRMSVVKSYDAVSGPLDATSHAPLIDATRRASAHYLLSSAVIGYGRKTVVEQGPLPYLGAPMTRGTGAYGAWYGRAYRGWGGGFAVTATTVRQVDYYTVETVLVDAETDRIEWTIRTKSAAGTELADDADDLVSTLTGAMRDAGLVSDDD